jgi:hypothetical protein
MSRQFKITDPDFWESLTSPEMKDRAEAARAIGWRFAPVVMHNATLPESAVTALLELPPNGVLPRNRRQCNRIEVVIRGQIDVGGGVTLGPGDVEVTEAGEFFGPHRAGPDGALSVEVFLRADGMAIEFEDPSTAVAEMTQSGTLRN